MFGYQLDGISLISGRICYISHRFPVKNNSDVFSGVPLILFSTKMPESFTVLCDRI